jgi:hypothetical protein
MMIRDWVNCQYVKLEKDVIICSYFDERCDSVINCRQEQEIEQEERDNPYHGIFSQKTN